MLRSSSMLMVALFAIAAQAQHPPLIGIRRSSLLRLDGAFAESRDAARHEAGAAVSMGFGDVARWFAAHEARTVGGDPALSGRAVLNAVAPLQPNLLVVGPPDLRARLEALPDGMRVRVEGLVDSGARTFLLREVRVGDAHEPGTP